MTDKPPLIESLRRYGSDFISHAASRGIEDIEAAGELMLAAARVLAEQPAEQEPVAAQHRFRRPEKGTPDWSVWQPCKINNKRPAHEIDSQGYQVEYRALYTAPQPTAVPAESAIDAAYWDFDARHQGYGPHKTMPPQSERDAFKGAVRAMLAAAIRAMKDKT